MPADFADRGAPELPGNTGVEAGQTSQEQREDAPAQPARERFGRVWLQRLRKDDGRALILYEQLEPGPP
jgi:hypothetical protein